jgi:U6 snRNA-associated Sm-like protein LSm1|uniref:U6 snRNA-associated Sm-like protein LSm1 n=1 Tax=Mantoniella antarctica TaxID=81844 RepID=A0A7S0XAQ4_9CHLO|mmetsp:Transcript_12414/g.20083  ORF Transcript_12414/g.20083 Transcript_12414/m.20083 type:complete len:125 (+) Transcript_12414:235-609(+)|eukprot:CAMPEP_0181369988 /NCGR_PEP_ID=MMETSP1106-20121128/13129_1 /TAXON_ID=81844 /ORGANISM="Mantoniella antarctica, Strain SL-175" /LENGTH=124 /DNA_ID=CAMNT_0023486637 /DNA_START=207 /DNA_END=584 /DNA_ORIENTATION=+
MADTWQLSAVASLVEELDKKLLVVLRDGSKILGTLRSFDQFANIVLEAAVERIIVGSSFSDIPLGLYIVRGENVVLMGEVDEGRETEGLTAVDNDEIKRAREAEKAADKLKGEMLKRMDFLDLD